MDIVSPLVTNREPAVFGDLQASVRSTIHLRRPNFLELSTPFLAMRRLIPRFLKELAHTFCRRRLCRRAASRVASSACPSHA
jgi:hypothetical protein